MLKAIAKKVPVFSWHSKNIYGSRLDRLIPAISDLAGRADRMLDVGCGDGTLAKAIAQRVGAKELFGIDVLLRPNRIIDVREYDGKVIPFESGQFDLITVNDVLHHADDPGQVVREMLRVLAPKGVLVIKDHFRLGPVSNSVLWAMDVVGNFSPGVLVRGHYLSPTEWVDVVAAAGGTVQKLVWPFVVHNAPWRWVARSEYQFLMRVGHAESSP